MAVPVSAPAAAMDTRSPDAALRPAWPQLLSRVDHAMRELAAHPARTVVLLPYLQLVPLARRCWARQFPQGFAPHFETTRTWAERVGSRVAGPTDLSFNHGRDLLVARSLLEGAGDAGLVISARLIVLAVIRGGGAAPTGGVARDGLVWCRRPVLWPMGVVDGARWLFLRPNCGGGAAPGA